MVAKVKVLYFAAAAEAAGATEELLTADDTRSLRRQLTDKYPALAAIPFRMALNKTMLKGEAQLTTNDIIAILPPFQGG
jgi:molybdopterin converting factor small subunit